MTGVSPVFAIVTELLALSDDATTRRTGGGPSEARKSSDGFSLPPVQNLSPHHVHVALPASGAEKSASKRRRTRNQQLALLLDLIAALLEAESEALQKFLSRRLFDLVAAHPELHETAPAAMAIAQNLTGLHETAAIAELHETATLPFAHLPVQCPNLAGRTIFSYSNVTNFGEAENMFSATEEILPRQDDVDGGTRRRTAQSQTTTQQAMEDHAPMISRRARAVVLKRFSDQNEFVRELLILDKLRGTANVQRPEAYFLETVETAGADGRARPKKRTPPSKTVTGTSHEDHRPPGGPRGRSPPPEPSRTTSAGEDGVAATPSVFCYLQFDGGDEEISLRRYLLSGGGGGGWTPSESGDSDGRQDHSSGLGLPRSSSSEGPVSRFLSQIAGALAHVHKCGLLHRGISLESILIQPILNTALVSDFGLSCDATGSTTGIWVPPEDDCSTAPAADFVHRFIARHGPGSVDYLAPEVLAASSAASPGVPAEQHESEPPAGSPEKVFDAAGDMFSFGVVAAKALFFPHDLDFQISSLGHDGLTKQFPPTPITSGALSPKRRLQLSDLFNTLLSHSPAHRTTHLCLAPTSATAFDAIASHPGLVASDRVELPQTSNSGANPLLARTFDRLASLREQFRFLSVKESLQFQRGKVFHQIIKSKIHRWPADVILAEWRTELENESGVDGGGLRREIFMLFFEQMEKARCFWADMDRDDPDGGGGAHGVAEDSGEDSTPRSGAGSSSSTQRCSLIIPKTPVRTKDFAGFHSYSDYAEAFQAMGLMSLRCLVHCHHVPVDVSPLVWSAALGKIVKLPPDGSRAAAGMTVTVSSQISLLCEELGRIRTALGDVWAKTNLNLYLSCLDNDRQRSYRWIMSNLREVEVENTKTFPTVSVGTLTPHQAIPVEIVDEILVDMLDERPLHYLRNGTAGARQRQGVDYLLPRSTLDWTLLWDIYLRYVGDSPWRFAAYEGFAKGFLTLPDNAAVHSLQALLEATGVEDGFDFVRNFVAGGRTENCLHKW